MTSPATRASTRALGVALIAAMGMLVVSSAARAEDTREASVGPRSWCSERGTFLYDDAGNTFPPQQCTWRARREAEFFQACIDAAPRPRHARRWLDFARDCGFEISDRCVPGAIAVARSGRFGHVGICTEDLGSGRFRIVDMNNDGKSNGSCRDGVAVKASLYRFILPPREPGVVEDATLVATAERERAIDPAERVDEPAPDGTVTLASAD